MHGALPPSGNGAISSMKLAPLPVKAEDSNGRIVAASIKEVLDRPSSNNAQMQESISSPDLIPKKATTNINRNMELYSSLEDARLEIESLKAAIGQISSNVQEGIM